MDWVILPREGLKIMQSRAAGAAPALHPSANCFRCFANCFRWFCVMLRWAPRHACLASHVLPGPYTCVGQGSQHTCVMPIRQLIRRLIRQTGCRSPGLIWTLGSACLQSHTHTGGCVCGVCPRGGFTLYYSLRRVFLMASIDCR